MMRSELRGHAAALLAVLFFGLMSPVSKLVMQGGIIDGALLASFRIAGSAILFWLLSLLVPSQPIRRRDWPALIGMSLCGMACNQYLFVIGVQYTSPTNACVVTTSTPVMTMAMAALVLHERLTRRRVLGLVLGAGGALTLILGSASGSGQGGSVLGDVLCLLSQFFACCYFIFFGGLIRRYRTLTLMKWLFAISALGSLPFMAPSWAALPWAALSWREWAGMLYVVLIGTFVCYILLIMAQRRLSPSVVATYNYVQPAVAATAGVLWGLDVLTFQKLLAVLLIIAGVRLVTVHTPSREARTSASAPSPLPSKRA